VEETLLASGLINHQGWTPFPQPQKKKKNQSIIPFSMAILNI
jgi:hypothetical protein